LSVLQVKTSEIFEKNYTASTRIVVNQGGSRSGKTYSILQMLIVIAMQEKGKVFSIVRKSLPSLKMTAYRDFFEILRAMDL
jgi:phage terminase large subunit